VLAESHETMRRSLRRLLEAEHGVRVIAEATDRATAISLLLSCRPAVLVLDPSLWSGCGLEFIRRLRNLAPRTQIVILTMQEIPAFAQQALNAGAVGFVMKDRADTELTDAVRAAVRGHIYASPRVAPQLAARGRD